MTTNNIVIASMARTPIAKFRGSLASFTATDLGSIAVRGALHSLPHDLTIKEAFLGNVVSAGIGQAPCRQAVIKAGLPQSTISTTINKVCASGMKSVMFAATALKAMPKHGAIIAGGMESMSNIPHYLPTSRTGKPLGHLQLIDGVIHDGLWDCYNDQHMGMCAEKCAAQFNISREQQDHYTTETYRRAQHAVDNNFFQEIVPVSVKQRQRGGGDDTLTTITKDEEPHSLNLHKLATLKPAFDRNNGTVTAANASSLNDGASAMVIMTQDQANDMGITPLAKILGFADAETAPLDFTIAPSLAVPIALDNAGVTAQDVDYHEINEAFSVVALANMQLLGLDHSNVNVFGGAVALGHPIGMSGARIIGTLYSVLKHRDATVGCASICNGGGGASAIVIERLS